MACVSDGPVIKTLTHANTDLYRQHFEVYKIRNILLLLDMTTLEDNAYVEHSINRLGCEWMEVEEWMCMEVRPYLSTRLHNPTIPILTFLLPCPYRFLSIVKREIPVLPSPWSSKKERKREKHREGGRENGIGKWGQRLFNESLREGQMLVEVEGKLW